jgi:hypothetical protein
MSIIINNLKIQLNKNYKIHILVMETINILTQELHINTNSNASITTSSNTSSNASITTSSNASITNSISINNKKQVNCVDFKYICIKKDFYDVNMIYLNYTNLKKNKYIEIIYKSPSIFLEGLFFKTPPINASQIRLIYKDKNKYNYITVKITLDNENEKQVEFIKMLKKTDEYINNYIYRFAKDINNEVFKDVNSLNIIEMFNYDNILKYNEGKTYEITMKSYLDKHSLDILSTKSREISISNNTKYIFTFNITNIYLGNVNLIPLIKCNKCEPIQIIN